MILSEFYKILKKHQASVPVDVYALATDLGIDVIYSDELPINVSGLIQRIDDIDNQYVIIVNGNHSPTRNRFTIAHEIGHYILHQDEIGNGIVDRNTNSQVMFRSETISSAKEKEANMFAADILMPLRRVREAIVDRGINNIEGLATYFDVSPAAMSIRMEKFL